MRGYDKSAVGIHHGGNDAASRQLGAGDRRPSKLELMRDDYQRKILREKEEKMVQLYEESKTNQRQAMMRVMARNGSGGAGGAANGQAANNGSIRDFFNERRRMEANGMQVPPIDNHYRQAKGYNSPGGWSSRTGSGNSAKKVSAGRDRSQPLAPIRRPGDTAATKTTQGNGAHGPTPRDEGSANGNPFKARPQLVKHKPLPPSSNRVDNNNNEEARSQPAKYGYQARMQQQQQQQKQQQLQQQRQQQQPRPPPQYQRQPQPPAAANQTRRGEPKMTDFQKWQLEQNKAREERLKKLNSHNNNEYEDEPQPFGESNSALSNRSRNSHAQNGYHNDDDGDESGDEGYEDEAKRLERELLEKINREQAELKRIQAERDRAEKEEREEREERKKREAAERLRQKKLDEIARKEEERQRKEDEEEYKRDRVREEKRQKEEEKQRKEMEKRRREEEKQAQKRRKEEEARQARLQKQQAKSSRSDFDMNSAQSNHYDDTPFSPSRRSPPLPSNSRQNQHETMDDIDETPAVGHTDSSYYAQMAKSGEAKGSTGSLAKCRVCGRTFAQDRLKKHQDACKNVAKPRKAFDVTKHRLEGTGAEKYQGKSKRPEPKKKNNWRSKHEEFIQSLRYAKKATQIEKEGGDIRNLTPPPATQNPDLVGCPNCGRTFNVTAAERHIPRCKELKTRPPPMKTKRR